MGGSEETFSNDSENKELGLSVRAADVKHTIKYVALEAASLNDGARCLDPRGVELPAGEHVMSRSLGQLPHGLPHQCIITRAGGSYQTRLGNVQDYCGAPKRPTPQISNILDLGLPLSTNAQQGQS